MRAVYAILFAAVVGPWLSAGPIDAPAAPPIGATVGGNVAPDGTEIQFDIPSTLHVRNVGGSDGSGLCVYASAKHSGLWHSDPVFGQLFDWMKHHPGGSYPQKFDRDLAAFCAEKGLPRPAYLHVQSADLSIVKEACAAGLFPGITYDRSPTKRYGGQRIAHMVSLPHWDGTRAAILDNNYPQTYEWLDARELHWACVEVSGKYWAIVPLAPPVPPPPHNAVARRGALLSPLVCQSPLPAVTYRDGPPREQSRDYRWERFRDNDQRQLKLVVNGGGRRDGDQVGTLVQDGDDDVYYPLLPGGGFGPRCAPPIDPPVRMGEWPGRRRTFGVDRDRCAAREDAFSVSGAPVSREQALQLIRRSARAAGDGLPDRAGQMFVTLTSPDAQARAKFLADAAGAAQLSPWRGKLLANAYAPDDWHVQGLNYPALIVQDLAGRDLWHADAYAGPEALAEGLRRADPNYRPDQSPSGPNCPGGELPLGMPPHVPAVLGTIGVALLGARVLANRKKVSP